MSRLDSAIRRLAAQRDCLDHAARLIADLPGPVLEFGLGNGRTFDHLRELLPDREIFVFERAVAAHPDCIPDADHLFLGDFRDTVGPAGERLPAPAALAHCDIGTGDAAASQALADWLAGPLVRLMAPGGIVVSDQAITLDGGTPLPPPAGVAPGRLHLWRMPG